MSKLKSAMLISVGVLSIGAVGAGAASTTSAMSGDTYTSAHVRTDDTFDSDLAKAIAEKFDVDKTEVANVIQQVRDEHAQAWEHKWEQRVMDSLDKALSNGKITQEQYDHIKSAIQQMQSLYDSLDGKTSSERKAIFQEIKTQRDELMSWLKDQDLSPRLVFGFEGHGHYKHHDWHYGWNTMMHMDR